MTYKVYFEIYGKKLMKEVQAENENQARINIMNAIIFHKIKPLIDPEVERLMNIFGMKP